MKLTNYANQLKNSIFGKAMNCNPTDLANAGTKPQTKEKNNMTNTIAQTTIPVNVEADVLAEILKGKTLRYRNDGESTIVQGKERTFKVDEVESIFTAKKNGTRCAVVYAIDLDDGGRAKFRTLHIEGIEVIA